MPGRLVPLVNGEYYHIFNRGANKQPIFLNVRDFKRAVQIMEFYSFLEIRIKYSRFLVLSEEERTSILSIARKNNKKLIELVCFSFMPNHFHFILKQIIDNGISKYMSNFQNSYTKYYNKKYEKVGAILQGQFKAVRIEDDVQLLHLSRYIHLNPYISFVVKNISDFENYSWSSYSEYLNKSSNNICNKSIILSQFEDIQDYDKFVKERVSYQRELDRIKHLLLEEI